MISKNSRIPENKEYQNGIREFYEITMQEFLQDTQGKNKVYSPLNVYMALAMLAETTEGESRQQLLDLLHTDSMETLRNNASILWNANYCDEGTVNSLLASSIWLSDKFTYNENTLKNLSDNYYVSSFSGTMGSAEYNKMLQYVCRILKHFSIYYLFFFLPKRPFFSFLGTSRGPLSPFTSVM